MGKEHHGAGTKVLAVTRKTTCKTISLPLKYFQLFSTSGWPFDGLLSFFFNSGGRSARVFNTQSAQLRIVTKLFDDLNRLAFQIWILSLVDTNSTHSTWLIESSRARSVQR